MNLWMADEKEDFTSCTGFITVPGSAGGMLFGGYIVKKFNLKCRGIIRFSCACLFLCMCLGPSFLASCPSQPIAGISTSYPTIRFSTLVIYNLFLFCS